MRFNLYRIKYSCRLFIYIHIFKCISRVTLLVSDPNVQLRSVFALNAFLCCYFRLARNPKRCFPTNRVCVCVCMAGCIHMELIFQHDRVYLDCLQFVLLALKSYPGRHCNWGRTDWSCSNSCSNRAGKRMANNCMEWARYTF